MHRTLYEKPDFEDWPRPSQYPPDAVKVGQSKRVVINSFGLRFKQGGVITQYVYSLTPTVSSVDEECKVLSLFHAQLGSILGVFFICCPGYILSPTQESGGELTVKDQRGKKYNLTITARDSVKTEMVTKFMRQSTELQVLMTQLTKKMLRKDRFQRVGRKYCDLQEESATATRTHFNTFAAAFSMLSNAGPQILVDYIYQPIHKKSVLEEINAAIENELHEDPENLNAAENTDSKGEWRRRCIDALVMTHYNSVLYCIKDVRFDMAVSSQFELRQRDEKKTETITFTNYYIHFYSLQVKASGQPLLEAYAKNSNEKVFLVPELCKFVGLNDDMRRDKNTLTEAMKHMKATPQERMTQLVQQVSQLAPPSQQPQEELGGIVSKWNLELDPTPMETDARQMDPLDVHFGQKSYQIEDGNFQRWMRNGLQCPTIVNKWLFLYPANDENVTEIWLRSLRDIAQVAFGMKMSEPDRIVIPENRQDIEALFMNKGIITANVQLVLLLTPLKDAKYVYTLFKKITTLHTPVVTQAVRSETVRKRQAIAAVLSRIVLQINAKFVGPLWHIDLKHNQTLPYFSTPTMLVGIDTYRNNLGELYLGFVGSLDMNATEYWSTAVPLKSNDDSGEQSRQKKRDAEKRDIAVQIQRALVDALKAFVGQNDGVLPSQVLVYRASTTAADWDCISATEIESFYKVFEAVTPKDTKYTPELTYVAIAKRSCTRIFTKDATGALRNPEPGTVIDSPDLNRSDMINFHMVNQAVQRGLAIPSHYTVLHVPQGGGKFKVEALQSLTHRLSYMYFNFTGAIRMPAPAQYAKKVASFVGQFVRAEPHTRLKKTYFYL